MLQSASDKRKRIATTLAFISIPLSGFVTDIYLPSFPAMAKGLHAEESAIQLTLTCFFISYGISQLLVGSLLDSIGRFKPAMWALGALIVTSLLIGMTNNVHLICLLRVLQGIAVAFVVISKRAFFVDMYSGDKLKNYLSYFTIIWSCGPIVAPFLGGYLQQYFHWQANFYFLAIYAGLMLIFELIYSGETIALRKRFDLARIKADYTMALGNLSFVMGIVILGLAYSVVLVFNIGGPFVIENTFHFSAIVTGYCTLILGFSWMIGGIIGKRLIHVNFVRKITVASTTQLLLIILLLGVGYVAPQLWCFMIFAFIIHICSGFLYNVHFTDTMLFFPQHAAMASGLLGGLVYVITSLSSFVLAKTGRMTTHQDMALRYLLLSGVLSAVVWLAVSRRKAALLKTAVAV
ncbi:MFS transporter [Chitinophaga rhizophila]|uniref:MFS transporter n=1 Tax=Chitinophaga rhizophila TaxID=2866212 RepID=A0ABS7GKQ5_9BACT|nr:MFS transporter [Chitinophaga rhizophila]MBW8688317.1 MFS transporter [Chitinophaga rhizophila]